MTVLKSYPFYSLLIFFFSALIIISGCGKDQKTSETKKGNESKETAADKKNSQVSPGKEFFYAKSSSNNIACADCHGDGTNSDRPLTKYFSDIKGADKRKSTFMGKFTGEDVIKTAGGATLCWEAYMKMKTPLTPEQINSLNEYYASVGNPDSPQEITYETIALPVKDKTKLKAEQNKILSLKGNPDNGENKFKESCGVCHGMNSTVKKIPGILEDYDGNTKSITYNVRFGDGAMPFFKMNVLSEQDIADIAEYIMKVNSKKQ
ncbi:MAG: cytochrome c [Bacteroidetes bacterium]|nr:cytochrome c [Bacteroidota bacterium]